jgi:hypothetical protein
MLPNPHCVFVLVIVLLVVEKLAIGGWGIADTIPYMDCSSENVLGHCGGGGLTTKDEFPSLLEILFLPVKANYRNGTLSSTVHM